MNISNSIKANLQIHPIPRSTVIAVIALSDNPQENVGHKIRMKASPFNGSVYNFVEDCFEVDCISFKILGSIPIAFKLTMNSLMDWNVRVPIPEDVVLEYLNVSQRISLDAFKEKFDDCSFVFLQCLGVN